MNSKIASNLYRFLKKSASVAAILSLGTFLTSCGGISVGVESFGSKSVSGITVKAITPKGTYRASQKLEFEVSFPSAVQVAGNPTLDLSTGRTAAQARYVRGSGTDKLIFEYTILPGDDIVLLDYLNPSALRTHAGSIKPLKDVELQLVLNTPGTQGSISHSSTIAIDTNAPTEVSNLDDGTGIADTTSAPIATWDHANDVSVIVYEIAIGATAGATDILDWTPKTALNNANHAGLSLIAGTMYYTSVRAVDIAGNIGSATTGNGWRAVDPLTISPALQMLITNERYPLSASGGWAPHSFSKVSGLGTLSGVVFQAPTSADTSVVKVQDSLSFQANATLTTRAFGHVLTSSRDGGPDMVVEDMAYDSLGNLYVAGTHNYERKPNWLVMKFDGTTWTVLEDSILGTVDGATPNAILVNSPNDIYVAGYIHTSTYAYRWIVRHFDGSTWATSEEFVLTAGRQSYANDIVRGADGSIYVVGAAQESASVERWVVRKLSGGVWSTSDSYRRSGTAPTNIANAAAVAPDGSIYVCGRVIQSSLFNPDWVVKKFNGMSWSEAEVFGAGSLNESCDTIAVDSSNNVYAGGRGGATENVLRKWNGTSWVSLGAFAPAGYQFLDIVGIEIDSSGRPVGVYEGYSSTTYKSHWLIGRYEPTPTLLHTFEIGVSTSVVRHPSGDLLVGGSHFAGIGEGLWHFRKSDGASLSFMTQYRMTRPTSHVVNDSAYDSEGNLYSVGYIETSPSTNSPLWLVRKFDGTTWSDLDTFSVNDYLVESEAHGILIDASDNIYVVGSGRDDDKAQHWIVRKFDGTSWTTSEDYYVATNNNHIAHSIISHAGSIYVAGWYLDSSDVLKLMIRKFDGTSWSTFQTFTLSSASWENYELDFLVDSSNHMWVAVAYDAESYAKTHLMVYKFDGTTWTTSDSIMSNVRVTALNIADSSGGEIFVSYSAYDGSRNYGNVRRFNGTAWADFDLLGAGTSHTTMKRDSTGNIYFGEVGASGSFIKKWNGHYFDEVYKPSLLSGYSADDVTSFAFDSSGRVAFFTSNTAVSDQRLDSALYSLAP